MTKCIGPRVRPTRDGITLIELVVVIAIFAVLMALLLPAVQLTRETARRMHCESNLKQIGIAIASYESTHQMFPPGSSQGFSFHVMILPHIGQSNLLYDQINFENPLDVNNSVKPVRPFAMPLYLCPSDPAAPNLPAPSGSIGAASTNYAGNSGTGVLKSGFDGLFQHLQQGLSGHPGGGPVTAADVADGLSNTAAVAEILHADSSANRLRTIWNTPANLSFHSLVTTCSQLPSDPSFAGWSGDPYARGTPWIAGDSAETFYNHVLPPDQPSCFNGTEVQTGIFTVSSAHNSGANVLYGDGHVEFANESISVEIWFELGSRH